jgi:2-phosphoglycerate kinase
VPDFWDPHGSLHRMLWIGGAQWAGKTTVAELIAAAHGLTVYHYDYHDARGHNDRRIAGRLARGEPVGDRHPDRVWVDPAPEELAADTLAGFPARFEWVLDDLRALFTGRPAIAEGWGLRPELVAPLIDAPRRMVVLVPTEDFRRYQLRTTPRAGVLHVPVSDPDRAQANRVARDRLVAEDAVRNARRLGVRVIEVDGSRDAAAVAAEVAGQFAPYLDLP